jgi:hypothetical protein
VHRARRHRKGVAQLRRSWRAWSCRKRSNPRAADSLCGARTRVREVAMSEGGSDDETGHRVVRRCAGK